MCNHNSEGNKRPTIDSRRRIRQNYGDGSPNYVSVSTQGVRQVGKDVVLKTTVDGNENVVPDNDIEMSDVPLEVSVLSRSAKCPL